MVSVLDPVTRHAEATPDNIAIRGTDNHWTYRQLHDASLAFAGRIRDEGLSVGDRVLLAAPSVPEFIVAYMGIQAAGCVVVPINTMSAQPEVEYVLDDAEISLAIAWHQLGPAVQDAGVRAASGCGRSPKNRRRPIMLPQLWSTVWQQTPRRFSTPPAPPDARRALS
ncbi:hypothetical protein GCM10020255_032470 [Rhodococcus baikonurensis]